MLFGNNAPKIVYGDTEIILENSVILKDEPEEDIIIHQSVFTKHREVIIKGKYWIVEIKTHLFKRDQAEIDYFDLKAYENMNLRFHRHSDGDYLKDANGDEVKVFIESIDEGYLNTTDYKDLLFLRLRSVGYVDLTQNVET